MRRYDSTPSFPRCFGFPLLGGTARADAAAEAAWSPRFLYSPLVRLPCSRIPVGPPRLALRTTGVGESLFPAAFAYSPVPQSDLARCLAASWRIGAVPAIRNSEDPERFVLSGLNSHGLRTRCLRFAAFLSRRIVQPRKTHFRLVANLYRAGLVTRRTTL
jgi:hypothetical protein